MRHKFGTSHRPFEAIKNKTKKVEYRTTASNDKYDFSSVKAGDELLLFDEDIGEELELDVVRVSHYNSTRKALENEGLSHSSSKPKTIEEAIDSIESHTGYKEAIKKHGLYAIELQFK
ncbi:MAG TPA: hypothetical protein ENI23_09865 [bacterium]|nr:hypothetical protein [bacterium]